ncbi:transferrin-binding protein-like solute binding protein [Pasteurella skyensis]|uniref:Transferrin-binding protein-like solute binding protein n=1 Tax=Phocoenobacter skyensis TaxID=97481 RepID=A0AAJ6NB15_9PAST|nr:transferrin-binding protein-like solute binding protein [Pasteurella skyensis]MDP8163326.1 transferrin-binding protein-like solute binding protein [Pasteurella skyensis]MDP8173527.1 transferrin-binding protein-like solute binding protein [Pasteurella skyensis]MDP8177244.1 transferrin-binding protein-like solute binding protein [Pasteurella skyensis]MDP8179744.1 transferrin-binding protein-like solute binding protein [Pasteurella skyensis]MDP8183858.1 transferrin-binding protein-like solute 
MKKLILSTAMALILTACGSGGNSGLADMQDSQNMPKLGIVTYIGDAYGGTEALTKGKSKIDVDFGNKTLKGTLSWQNYKFLSEEGKAQTIHFSADIRDNRFEGTNVKGNFFGNNTAEVVGIYYNKQKEEGVIFGAKKQ